LSLAPALLIGAVVAVGILHTAVPDHWLPIALLARHSHWSPGQIARAATIAGFGHACSTLVIGAIVWLAGVALAARFGHLTEMLSSVALITFGTWISLRSWREILHDTPNNYRNALGVRALSRPTTRLTLLLVLGSSPMVEGLPAFFAAARFGAPLLAVMAAAFTISTVVAYVALCVFSGATLQRVSLGRFERYDEVFSGAVIALVGVIFLIWPL
jgi:putative Mn2+ efflux pump MntP